MIFNLLFKKTYELFSRLFGRRGSIYYVNGPDMLPAPLSKEDEALLLSRLPDPEARNILIEHNLRLVVYIAKRFENTGINIEDLTSIGTLGLIKAINSFCPDKNIKLATYASRCIENEILMYIRKISGRHAEISIDEPLKVDWDGNELLLSDILGSDEEPAAAAIMKKEETDAIYEAINSLDPRERQIIIMRYGLYGQNEMTQKEVADALGISQSYISRLEKKIISRLYSDLSGKI